MGWGGVERVGRWVAARCNREREFRSKLRWGGVEWVGSGVVGGCHSERKLHSMASMAVRCIPSVQLSQKQEIAGL